MNVQKIRKELKEQLGYNSRMVSIKNDYGNVIFTIRNIDVDYAKLEQFAYKFENVSYCEASGEILSGGNTFVTIEFCETITEIFATTDIEGFDTAVESLNNFQFARMFDNTLSIIKNGGTYTIRNKKNEFSNVQTVFGFGKEILNKILYKEGKFQTV